MCPTCRQSQHSPLIARGIFSPLCPAPRLSERYHCHSDVGPTPFPFAPTIQASLFRFISSFMNGLNSSSSITLATSITVLCTCSASAHPSRSILNESSRPLKEKGYIPYTVRFTTDLACTGCHRHPRLEISSDCFLWIYASNLSIAVCTLTTTGLLVSVLDWSLISLSSFLSSLVRLCTRHAISCKVVSHYRLVNSVMLVYDNPSLGPPYQL